MQPFVIMSYAIAFVGWLFFVLDDPFSPMILAKCKSRLVFC